LTKKTQIEQWSQNTRARCARNNGKGVERIEQTLRNRTSLRPRLRNEWESYGITAKRRHLVWRATRESRLLVGRRRRWILTRIASSPLRAKRKVPNIQQDHFVTHIIQLSLLIHSVIFVINMFWYIKLSCLFTFLHPSRRFPTKKFDSISKTLPTSFFIISGVRLSLLVLRPIVPATYDRWWWLWSNWWNEDWQRKSKYSEKTCPSATVSTTNPTWLDPGLKPGRRVGYPATNSLSYGAVNQNGCLWITRSQIWDEYFSENTVRHSHVICWVFEPVSP
jgi:hypothetical protein